MLPRTIQKAAEHLSKLPSIGQRTAMRIILALLKFDKKEFRDLMAALLALREKIKLCRFCFKPFEPKNQDSLCEICQDPNRDQKTLSIVEKEVDLEALENTGKFKGIYFILGGTLEKLKKESPLKAKLEALKKRIERPAQFGLLKADFQEVIIATNPTLEGEATRLYLEKILKPFNKKITRLARGLATGGELEYADEETLRNALEGRK